MTKPLDTRKLNAELKQATAELNELRAKFGQLELAVAYVSQGLSKFAQVNLDNGARFVRLDSSAARKLLELTQPTLVEQASDGIDPMDADTNGLGESDE